MKILVLAVLCFQVGLMQHCISEYCNSTKSNNNICESVLLNNNITTITIFGNMDAKFTCPYNKNMYCDWSTYPNSLNIGCRNKLNIGAICSYDFQCISGLCSGDFITHTSGFCLSLKIANNQCTSARQCKFNMYCGADEKCLKRIDYKSPCNYTDQCYWDAECVKGTCTQFFTTKNGDYLVGNLSKYGNEFLCEDLFLNPVNTKQCGNIMSLPRLIYDPEKKSKKCQSDSDCSYKYINGTLISIKQSCQCAGQSKYCIYGGSEPEVLFAISDVNF